MKDPMPAAEDKQKQKKNMARDYAAMAAVIVLAALLLLIFPHKSQSVLEVAKNYMVELALIMPAIMIIIGLFSVWVSKEKVAKYLGKTSGIKGIFLSIGLGALPTGPLYIAFPMAAALIRKGARISNIIIFISAWACIKLPQELVEIQFLGLEFTLLRLSLTVASVIAMGLIIEKLIHWTDKKQIMANKE